MRNMTIKEINPAAFGISIIEMIKFIMRQFIHSTENTVIYDLSQKYIILN